LNWRASDVHLVPTSYLTAIRHFEPKATPSTFSALRIWTDYATSRLVFPSYNNEHVGPQRPIWERWSEHLSIHAPSSTFHARDAANSHSHCRSANGSSGI